VFCLAAEASAKYTGWPEGEPFFENAEFTELLSRGHKAQSVVCERGFISKVS